MSEEFITEGLPIGKMTVAESHKFYEAVAALEGITWLEARERVFALYRRRAIEWARGKRLLTKVQWGSKRSNCCRLLIPMMLFYRRDKSMNFFFKE